MLEVTARDGHGRMTRWEPSDGQVVTTPHLVLPDVPFCPRPDWAEVTITQAPKGQGVELFSEGTWFHPHGGTEDLPGATGSVGLVVPALQPGPTAQVQLLDVGEELVVFHDAGGWVSEPRQAVQAWIEARTRATPGRLLWAPAMGTPADYALWTYLGADLFDASPLLLAAARGEALTTDGVVSAAEAEELLGAGSWDAQRLAAWNLETAWTEIRRVRHAIRTGTLRALVERRVYGDPHQVAVLRRFDREHAFLSSAAPRHRQGKLACMTLESLTMPEMEMFRATLRNAYRPPASPDILVLLPCSARKPYALSKSHRYFQRALDESGIRHRCHEVMVTSPLGLVPRELENTYPAQGYDVPVTGQWTADEEDLIRTQLAALLDAHEYTHVVAHVPQSTFDAVRDLLPEDAHHTALSPPQSREACGRLLSVLRALRDTGPKEDPRSGGRRRKTEDLHALASFQFGADAADALFDGAVAHGKVPFVKLSAGKTQLGMTTSDRGLLSLTLDGARRLLPFGVKQVHIQDFRIKKTSSLFAVGVDQADPDIRIGDEVLIVHGDELRGVGMAQMSAAEMTHLKRGVAVSVRHAA